MYVQQHDPSQLSGCAPTNLLQPLPICFCVMQGLSDQQKIEHSRSVAERGLSDLQSYSAMNQGSGFAITLKGATG